MAEALQADTDRIEVTPLSRWIAADVAGVDLAAPMSDAVFGRIYHAWLDHQVLRFRRSGDHRSADDRLQPPVR